MVLMLQKVLIILILFTLCRRRFRRKARLRDYYLGSGNGAAMTANKHQSVRAALCWTKEIVALAREHNNANVLSLPARFISIPHAIAMVEAYITTDFEGGRHQGRIDKIPCS